MLTETSSINFRTNNSCSNSCNYLARKNAMALYNKDDNLCHQNKAYILSLEQRLEDFKIRDLRLRRLRRRFLTRSLRKRLFLLIIYLPRRLMTEYLLRPNFMQRVLRLLIDLHLPLVLILHLPLRHITDRRRLLNLIVNLHFRQIFFLPRLIQRLLPRLRTRYCRLPKRINHFPRFRRIGRGLLLTLIEHRPLVKPRI